MPEIFDPRQPFAKSRHVLDFEVCLCNASAAARVIAVPHIVHNEQTKLFAGMLDRVGTVCLAVGVATPISAFVIGPPQVQMPNLPWLIGSGLVWTGAFIALHQVAQNVLEDLRE